MEKCNKCGQEIEIGEWDEMPEKEIQGRMLSNLRTILILLIFLSATFFVLIVYLFSL